VTLGSLIVTLVSTRLPVFFALIVNFVLSPTTIAPGVAVLVTVRRGVGVVTTRLLGTVGLSSPFAEVMLLALLV